MDHRRNESAASLRDRKFHLVRECTTVSRWHPLHLLAEDPNSVYRASFHPAILRVPRNCAVSEAEMAELEPAAPAAFTQAGDGAL